MATGKINAEIEEVVPIPPRSSMTSSSGSASRRTSMETRTSRSSSSRSRSSSTMTKERTKTSSSRELALLLALEQNKSDSLKSRLDEAMKEVAAQRRARESAETNLIEATSAFMKANKERLEALQNAEVIYQERELYRIQLLAAQGDIDKAKNIVKTIDERRVQAEKDAAKYRRSARQLREERLVLAAREEGRRIGFKEGLQRARAEVGFLDIAEDGFVTPPTRDQLDSLLNEERESFYTEDELDPDPEPMASEPPSIRNSLSQPTQTYSQPEPPPSASPPRENLTSVPLFNETGQIHPIVIHNMPMSPHHLPVNIPPDGMIPVDNEFGGISLPPPHELSSPPPIIEIPSISTQRIVEEEPRIVPPPGSRRTSMYTSHSDYYRASSPESQSTDMSQFDMLTAPKSMMANLSPLSAIEEVASRYSSPNPTSMQGGDLHRSSSMRSTTSTYQPPSPIPHAQTPRAQLQNLPDTQYSSSGKLGRKQSSTSVTSSKRAKSPASNNIPPMNYRPYSPPQVSNIYSNPRYQTSNGGQEYSRPTSTEAGRRSQTPTQRSHAPFVQEEPPPFVPPESFSNSSSRKPSRKSSMTSAASTSRTNSTRNVPTIPTASQMGGGVYTTLAPPESQTEAVSPRTESSDDNINVSILSPTPPGSTRYDNEEGVQRNHLNEFLSPRDAERPLPMPGSPSPRLHPIGLNEVDPPLPTAPFGSGSPNIGTPIAMGGSGIFIPSSFTPKPPPGPALSPSPGTVASSALPETGLGLEPNAGAMPGQQYPYGMSPSNQRPVIPDPTLLGAPDSDSDSSDRVSSGMNSDANTLTTPPNLTRGLPAQRGRGARGKATTGKKKRR